MEEILVPLTLFLVTGILIWKYIDGRQKESQAMLEKGLMPVDNRRTTISRRYTMITLKWSLLAIFSGIGFILGLVLRRFVDIDEVIILPSTVICGGIGLLIFYFIATRALKESERKESAIAAMTEHDDIRIGS